MLSHLSAKARSLGLQRKIQPRSHPRRSRGSHPIFSSSSQMQSKTLHLTTPVGLNGGSKPFQCLPPLWRETNSTAHSHSLPTSPEHAPLQCRTQLLSWRLVMADIPTLCVPPPHCYNRSKYGVIRCKRSRSLN